MKFFNRSKKMVHVNLDPNYRYGFNNTAKELVGVHVTVWPLSPKSGVPNNLVYVPVTSSTPAVLAQRAEEHARVTLSVEATVSLRKQARHLETVTGLPRDVLLETFAAELAACL